MKNFQLPVIALLAFLTLSCMGANRDDNSSNSFFGKKTATYDFKDAKTGLAVFSVDYPSNWKVISKPTYRSDKDFPFFQYQIQGPHGLKAFNSSNFNYVSYSNPEMAQLSRVAYGTQNLRPLISMQQLIQQDIEPKMRKQGFTLTETRALPTLEQFYKQKVAENAPMPAQPELNATIWSNAQGQKSLVLVSRINYIQQMGQYGTSDIWQYTVDYLVANTDSFEEVVDKAVKAHLSSRQNPQWKNHAGKIIAQRTQVERRRAELMRKNNELKRRISYDSHQARMRTLNSIQDANHAAFMERTFGSGSTSSSSYSDGGHENYLNMIRGEETVYNPGDGKNYQIDAGSKEYWMDSNGNQIQSNDLFFDPNTDMNLNQGEWSKVYEDY